LSLEVDKTALERACKEIIETILFCLPNAYKGTVYTVGTPPEMNVTRVTSGIIDRGREKISWGLPEQSDYNAPGKPWSSYRDQPERPLEAMAWCVEKQRSWTSEDPKQDPRSVRLQLEGLWEDFHHMEPVLIRKKDLFLGNEPRLEYPKNADGEVLWQKSEYVVVAVIKIHFNPHTIKIGSPECKIIKRLSHSLGTELLSYQLRQQSVEAMRQLAEDKINSCNILADSLRNAVTKSGLIYPLIKLELGSLREQWEQVLLGNSDQKAVKRRAVQNLNEVLWDLCERSDGGVDGIVKELMEVQAKFVDLSLPPKQGEKWLHMQIEDRWTELKQKGLLSSEADESVNENIQQLKTSLYLGQDPSLLKAYEGISDPLKEEWTQLIYKNTDHVDIPQLERVIQILDDPTLNLAHQEKSRRSLIHLKILAEIMGELEKNTNTVLREVLNTNNSKLKTS